MNIYKIVLFGVVVFSLPVDAMDTLPVSKKGCYSIILPGQDGSGGESYQENNIVRGDSITLQTLGSFIKIDLGQGNCVKDFLRQITAETSADWDNYEKLTLHGVSQGTATLIRAFSQLPEEVRSKIQCLTLESVLADGNSAIAHTTNNLLSPLHLPFSRWWLPWVAKCVFPTYNPLARQALHYAKSLPANLPVIIMHDQKDYQLSVNDARKLYCTLVESRKSEKNKNVYLLEIDSQFGSHLDVLDYEKLPKNKQKKITAIQQIYKNHDLPYNDTILPDDATEVDLGDFQPDVTEVKQRIKRTNGQYFWNNVIDSVAAVGLIAYGYVKWGKNIQSFFARSK